MPEFDGRNLAIFDQLGLMIASYFTDLVTPLKQSVEYAYKWAAPSEAPVAFERKGHAFYDTIALRDAMHREWLVVPWQYR